LAKWSLTDVSQVIDLLGLMGDSSDNIPGCPGVGEKTAIKLLNEFGSIDNLLKNTDKLKGALKTKVEENREKIEFSRFLATIKTDVPIELEEDKLLKKEPDKEQLLALFTELEFRSFINKLLDNEQSVTSAKLTSKKQNIQQGVLFADEMTVVEDTPQITLDSVELVTDFASVATTAHTYKAVQTDTEIAELIALLSAQKEFCFDTETTSVEARDAELVGLSFAVEPHTAYYVPISANPAEAKVVLAKFKPVFENEAIRKIGQNIKFDLMVLDNYGITVRGSLFDTMIAHYLINPELRHGMDYLAEILLNYRTIHIEELIDAKGKNQLNMRQVSFEKITEYAAEDADITLQLKLFLSLNWLKINLTNCFTMLRCRW